MPFLFDNVIREDSYAQIMCVVTEGDPPFSIAWSFHGHNLTSSNLQIRTSNIGDRTSLLMIPNVSYKHMGNYTCKVSNKAGSSSHTAILKVKVNQETLDILLLPTPGRRYQTRVRNQTPQRAHHW